MQLEKRENGFYDNSDFCEDAVSEDFRVFLEAINDEEALNSILLLENSLNRLSDAYEYLRKLLRYKHQFIASSFSSNISPPFSSKRELRSMKNSADNKNFSSQFQTSSQSSSPSSVGSSHKRRKSISDFMAASLHSNPSNPLRTVRRKIHYENCSLLEMISPKNNNSRRESEISQKFDSSLFRDSFPDNSLILDVKGSQISKNIALIDRVLCELQVLLEVNNIDGNLHEKLNSDNNSSPIAYGCSNSNGSSSINKYNNNYARNNHNSCSSTFLKSLSNDYHLGGQQSEEHIMSALLEDPPLEGQISHWASVASLVSGDNRDPYMGMNAKKLGETLPLCQQSTSRWCARHHEVGDESSIHSHFRKCHCWCSFSTISVSKPFLSDQAISALLFSAKTASPLTIEPANYDDADMQRSVIPTSSLLEGDIIHVPFSLEEDKLMRFILDKHEYRPSIHGEAFSSDSLYASSSSNNDCNDSLLNPIPIIARLLPGRTINDCRRYVEGVVLRSTQNKSFNTKRIITFSRKEQGLPSALAILISASDEKASFVQCLKSIS